MAKRIVLIDDLDGSEGADTLTFQLNGVTYEIDLGAKNAAMFEKGMKPFVDASRVVGRGGVTRSKAKAAPKAARKAPVKSAKAPARRRNTSDPSPAKIRAWAKENKIQVPARGRIPDSVREAFAAH